MVFSRILYAKMCRALDCFFLLYKKLSHIFRNLDTQFMILDCRFKKPKKTSKKTLSLIFYKNLLEITIEKIRPILKYKKFNGIRHCRCINCFEDYESFDSAFCNLVDKLSETLTLKPLISVNPRFCNPVFFLYYRICSTDSGFWSTEFGISLFSSTDSGF